MKTKPRPTHRKASRRGEVRARKDRIAAGHNPDMLTVKQVGKGWRLLAVEEIHFKHEFLITVEIWTGTGWRNRFGLFACLTNATYRTQKPRGFFLPKRNLTPTKP